VNAPGGVIKRKTRAARRFVATDEQRSSVVALRAVGATNERISSILGVDDKTLVRHFRKELETGLQAALAQVAGTLFRAAISGDMTACIFLMKTRAGWSEKSQVEFSGSVNTSEARVIYDGIDMNGDHVKVRSDGQILRISTNDTDEENPLLPGTARIKLSLP